MTTPHPLTQETEEYHIVVGIDGSKDSRAALEWAVAEARQRDAALQILHAFTYPGIVRYAPGIRDDFAAIAREILDEAIAQASELEPSVSVTGRLCEGSPAPSLIEASDDTDLLVVGSRGRGGFTGLLLGSVSQQCIHFAHCPVVVVRPPLTAD